MANISVGGGLGEEYMRAPQISVGGGDSKGGGSFFANILDLLGIHKQVAKGPKEGKDASLESAPVDQPSPPTAAPPPPGLTVLDEAQAAFQPLTPQASQLGKGGFNFLPMTLR